MDRSKLSELLHKAVNTSSLSVLLKIELELIGEALELSGKNKYQFNNSLTEMMYHFSDFTRRVQNSPYRGKIINDYVDIFADYCCE